MERNVGELDHSDVQTAFAVYLRTHYKAYWCGVEVRVQVKATRFRVPDVTLVQGGKPKGRVITAPPVLTIEVLSPDDRAGDMQERIDDYLAFGVPTVWVINPITRRAYIHTADGMVEVPLAAIFAD